MLEDGFPRIRKVGERPGMRWEFPFSNGEVTSVTVAPWTHAMGITAFFNRCLAVGGSLIVHQRLNAAAFLQDIEKYGVTFFGGAPSMFINLLSTPGIEKMNLSSVRAINSGSSPLPMELIARLSKVFTEAILVEGYGLTESTMTATTNPTSRHGLRKIGTVGLPFCDTEIKIVDDEEGNRELPLGETGEICIRGPQVMKGYYNRPEATAEVLRDGWLYTGDIGRVDEDGYLTILDRKKDMLIYKGYNVYPRELEEILFEHPAVSSCSVIGKRDPAAGEIPKAYVVLAEGRRASKKDLMDFVNDRVTPYKKLRELEFVDTLPMSAVGKVLKRVLREKG